MNKFQSIEIDQKKSGELFPGGNLNDVEQLYDQHSQVVYGVAFFIAKNEIVAEEILKETFQHAWKYRSTFNPANQPLRLWLISIARRIAHAQISFDDFLKNRTAPDNLNTEKENISKNETPYLQSAGKMTPMQKKIFEMVYCGGGKIHEVASHLSMEEPKVKQMLREAINQKRKEL